MLIGTEIVVLNSTATTKASPRRGSLGIIVGCEDGKHLYKHPLYIYATADVLFYRYGYEQKRFELKKVILISCTNYVKHTEIKSLFKRRLLTKLVEKDPRIVLLQDKKRPLIVAAALPVCLWKKEPACFQNKMRHIFVYGKITEERKNLLLSIYDYLQKRGGTLYEEVTTTTDSNPSLIFNLLKVIKAKNLESKKQNGFIPFYILSTVKPSKELVGELTSNSIKKGQKIITEEVKKVLRGEL